MTDAGLREAARIARYQAELARGEASRCSDQSSRKMLLMQARTAEALARTYETLADEEKTDPRALVLRTCANCGHPTPAHWTPPDG